ncbi:MAG TPA: hypothetical protein VHB98_24000 [Chloroflexota bacterium]|nr:hypothetical protein [Chloroflexota bacterium]
MNVSPQTPAPIQVPDNYGAFVQQITLQAIWLVHARVDNLVGPVAPGQAHMHIQVGADWSATDLGFRVLQTFTVSMAEDDQLAMQLEVVFGMDYASSMPMTAELFQPLNLLTLALAVWPYLREFLANMVSRMNWSGYILPTLVVQQAPLAAPQQAQGTTDSREKPPRRRRARTTKPKDQASGDSV